MPPAVRKIGSWAILSSIIIGAMTSWVINTSSWASSQIMAVEPLTKSVNELVKEVKSLKSETISMKHQIIEDKIEIRQVKKRCDENRQDIRTCQLRLFNGVQNGYKIYQKKD